MKRLGFCGGHRDCGTCPSVCSPAWLLVPAFLAFSPSCQDSKENVGSPPSAIPRGPQVALPTPTSVTIAFATASPALGAIEFGLDPTYQLRAYGPGLALEHRIEIDGLSPASQYHYRVLLNDQPEGPDRTFRTFPAARDAPIRFAVLGDCGSGSANQRAVASQLKAWAPAFVLITGDVVYESGAPNEITARYFVPYADLIAGIPFFPALGNHDVRTDGGRPLLDALILPTNDQDGTERYYSFDCANAHFAALDSTSDLGESSPQRAWLDADLARSDALWKFVYFHHPPYSSSHHGSSLGIRKSLAPIFEKHNVDIVFSGHDHDYERTFPMRAGNAVARDQNPNYRDPPGTIYVVTGGGGRSLYANGRSAFTAFSACKYHFVTVDIEGPELVLRMVLPDGSVLDSMTIAKSR